MQKQGSGGEKKSARLVEDMTTLDALADSLSGEKLQTEQIPMNVQCH